MKKILITGGAGFIGYHLAVHLLKNPENQLVLTDNLQRGRMDEDFAALLTNDRVRFLQKDLTDPAVYASFDADVDHVYHLAAVNGTKLFYRLPEEVLRVNMLSLIFLLEWIRGLSKKPKLCFTSSNEAYAGALESFGQLPIPTPEHVPLVISDPYNPRWSYAATKLAGELFVIHYAKAYGFPAVIVRPHNFYGPRAGYDHVLPEWSQKVIERQDPFVLYSPDETRSFCYITDAALAMQMLMDSDATNRNPIETVHIGSTEEIAMGELAKKFFAAAGWAPRAIDLQPSPPGSVKRRLGDIAKIRQMVGWTPATALEDGLKKTFAWYAAHPNISSH